MSNLHISISAEPVLHIGHFAVTNSMLTSVIASVLLLLFGLAVRMVIRTKGKPTRLQTMAEMLLSSFLGLIEGITGPGKKPRMFFPLIMTFFLVILFNNWIGLFPGVGTIGFFEEKSHEVQVVQSSLIANAEPSSTAPEEAAVHSDAKPEITGKSEGEHTESAKPESEKVFVPYLRAGTADLNTTLALAIITVFATQFFGVANLGIGYFKKFFDFSSGMNFFVGILELILEIAKIMSYAFRLFGNVFAGEVLLAVILFLAPVIAPMPFYGLELFVGLIQAVVFTMLSLVFFNMATIGHHDEEEHSINKEHVQAHA